MVRYSSKLALCVICVFAFDRLPPLPTVGLKSFVEGCARHPPLQYQIDLNLIVGWGVWWLDEGFTPNSSQTLFDARVCPRYNEPTKARCTYRHHVRSTAQ